MVTKRKAIILLSIPLMLFVGGAECDDQCSKCKSAIDHMADKIESQFCNPNTMQNAWDEIREECDHFDSAVGLMAESCAMGNLVIPTCNLPAENLEFAKIPIVLATSSNGLDFDFDIIFQFPEKSFHFGTTDIEENEIGEYFFRLLYFDVVVSEGDPVEIIVFNTETDQEIGRESINFSFARNSYWSARRHVVVADISTDHSSASIVFDSW